MYTQISARDVNMPRSKTGVSINQVMTQPDTLFDYISILHQQQPNIDIQI